MHELKEFYTSVLVETFLRMALWMTELDDMSSSVQPRSANGAPTLHIHVEGEDPAVLVDNTTYPINTITLDETGVSLSLKRYDTENTLVQGEKEDWTVYEVAERNVRAHRRALQRRVYQDGHHAIAPESNSGNFIVMKSTGTETRTLPGLTGNFSKHIPQDIVELAAKADEEHWPIGERVLVLDPLAWADLLDSESKGNKVVLANHNSGNFDDDYYGFRVYKSASRVFYNHDTETKNANGSLPTPAVDTIASFAFVAKEAVYADGGTKPFVDDEDSNPELRATVMGFRRYNMVLPKSRKYRAALLYKKN